MYFEQAGAQTGKKREGEHRKRHMTMPAVPTARLAVIKSGFALGGLETFLDRPPQPGDSGEVSKLARMRCECDIERQIGRIGDRTADQQPMVPGRRLQTQQTNAGPIIKSRTFRPLAGWQAMPVLRGKICGNILGRARTKAAEDKR